MASVNVFPARNDLPWYQMRIPLGGVIYTVHMRYNSRSQRWVMDINDSSDAPILSGIPVLINRDLTSQYPTLAVPAGTLFATDDTQQDTQPTQYSFGTDHTLYFVDPST